MRVECLKINESNFRNRFFEEFEVIFDSLDTFILLPIDKRVHFPQERAYEKGWIVRWIA